MMFSKGHWFSWFSFKRQCIVYFGEAQQMILVYVLENAGKFITSTKTTDKKNKHTNQRTTYTNIFWTLL